MSLCRQLQIYCVFSTIALVAVASVSYADITYNFLTPESIHDHSPCHEIDNVNHLIDGGTRYTHCTLFDDSLDKENGDAGTKPGYAVPPITAFVVFDMGKPMHLDSVKFTARNHGNNDYGPKNVTFFYYKDLSDDPVEDRILLDSFDYPKMNRMHEEIRSWKTPVRARYIGMQINDGYLTDRGGPHYNVQMAEVHFGLQQKREDSEEATSAEMERPRMYYSDTVSGRPFTKDPAVVKFRGKYWMYYTLPPYKKKPTRGYSIGIACSDNLYDWEKAGEMTNETGVERRGFCAPGAIVLDDKIHLFYQSYGRGKRDAICHAWSEDGINFTRNPTNPIFQPTGDWTSGRAIDADVIEHEGRLLLYWATRDPESKIQMQGVSAASIDSDFASDKWTQLNTEGPILKPELPWEKKCIEAAAMTKHDGRLYMFYAGGYNNQPQQIGVAVSDNGVDFTRLFDTPFLPNGPEGSWNSCESGHPYLFQDDDGKDYLFFQGNNTRGKTWYLSVVPIEWEDGKPVVGKE